MNVSVEKGLVTIWVGEKERDKTTYWLNYSSGDKGSDKVYGKTRLILTKKAVILPDETQEGKGGCYYGYFDFYGFMSCYDGKKGVVNTIIVQNIVPSEFEEEHPKKTFKDTEPVKATPRKSSKVKGFGKPVKTDLRTGKAF